MKTSHLLLAFTIAGWLNFAPALPAADIDNVPVPPPPTPPPVAALETLLTDLQAELPARAGRILLAQAGAAGQVATGGGSGGGGRSFKTADLFGRSGRGSRPVIVSTSAPDAKMIGQLDEDMKVMGRILDKATDRKDGDETRRAMGIAVHSLLGGTPSRSFYLEGYGAMFLLNVRFPLVPPPASDGVTKTNEPTSSTWEAARQEVYGRSPAEEQVRLALKNANPFGNEEYDAKRVEELKEDLLEALKNATHIRNVKPDEAITVVVQAGESSRSGSEMSSRGGGGAYGGAWATTSTADETRKGGGGESTLTIRVKKADADAFAAGKLDLAAFRKRAALVIY